MPSVATTDFRATERQVRGHARTIRQRAKAFGLGEPRLRSDGAVVVHSEEAGYRAVLQLSAAASAAVGAYVLVITDEHVEAELAAL